MISLQELKKRVWDLRKDTLDIVMSGGGGHIGGDMSMLEAIAYLYLCHMRLAPATASSPDRDRFVLSKGHSVEAYLAVLAEAGFLDKADVIENFQRFGSAYIGHPNNKLPGIEMNSGALGHGLPVAVGMALAGKMDRRDYRTYVIMGDGELAEGSVWEGAMAAGHYKLDRLCALIDRNHLQISGNTEDVMAQEKIADRFASFGWNVVAVPDGNDLDALAAAFDAAERCTGRPSLLIADTVKGYGSALMEGKAAWHHKVPTATQYQEIVQAFAQRKEAVQ